MNIKMLFRLFTLFAVVLLITACGTDKEGYRKSESGLFYKFIDDAEGEKPEQGDVMIMHIAYYTEKDSLLYDSGTISDSFSVKLVQPTFKGGVEEGFAMMSKGDSAWFKVSADSLFEKTFMSTLPDYMSKGSMVYFRVRLTDIIPKSFSDSIKSSKDLESRKQEFEKIEIYLKENNMDVMPTENGAYLYISKPGTGEYPKPGDSVVVVFTGRLLDGTVFDQSTNPDAPLKFTLGNGEVIQGWEECMPLLNKGAVARMVIPSDLAYGGEPIGALPAYSTLVFDVEILDIR